MSPPQTESTIAARSVAKTGAEEKNDGTGVSVRENPALPAGGILAAARSFSPLRRQTLPFHDGFTQVERNESGNVDNIHLQGETYHLLNKNNLAT